MFAFNNCCYDFKKVVGIKCREDYIRQHIMIMKNQLKI